MKFEKLDISNSKKGKWFLYGLIVGVALLLVSNLLFTKAKYKVVDSVKLASGTVNYESADFSLVALYIQNGNIYNPAEGYQKIEDGGVPQKDVKLNEEKTMCKVNSEEYIGKKSYESQGIIIEYKKGKLNFTGINKANTKCTIYFDYRKIGTAEDTLGSLGLRTDEVKDGQTSFNGIATEEDSGIFSGTDDYGTTYYYRGNVDNNWVQFAEHYWRIIRINGNGTVRLIYSGDSSAVPTGDGTSIATGTSNNYVVYNSSYNDNKYVGYMYDGEENSNSTSYNQEMSTEKVTNSVILDTINTWYIGINGIAEQYRDKLDGATGFCNDRQIRTSGTKWWNGEDGTLSNLGWGTHATAYAPFHRIMTISEDWANPSTPTFICGNKKRDLFTTEETMGEGNGKLLIPVGLITADEVIYAGGFGTQNNTGYWLYTGQYYWTMSPYYFSGSFARVFYVSVNGRLDYNGGLLDNRGVRPVINLKADTMFEVGGKGTTDNPYIVE